MIKLYIAANRIFARAFHEALDWKIAKNYSAVRCNDVTQLSSVTDKTRMLLQTQVWTCKISYINVVNVLTCPKTKKTKLRTNRVYSPVSLGTARKSYVWVLHLASSWMYKSTLSMVWYLWFLRIAHEYASVLDPAELRDCWHARRNRSDADMKPCVSKKVGQWRYECAGERKQ